MASPLAAFRKYQKILLAVFGVLLMLVFTVGGLVSQYLGSSGRGEVENKVVVRWKDGQLRESELQMRRVARYHLRQFQRGVQQTALQRGGSQDLIRRAVVPDTDAEASVVESLLLAREAEQLGVTVSDEAVLQYLRRQLSDDTIERSELAAILDQATGGRMTQQALFDNLRIELLAHQVRILANGAAYDGSIADTAVSPGESFEYFQRLYRRMEAEVMPVAVADFIEEVQEEPTEAEVQELYDEYKDVYPSPILPTPGFRRPMRAAFQWLKADFQAFLDREIENLADEQIEEYYESNKDSYRKLSLPTTDDIEGSRTDLESGAPGVNDTAPSDADLQLNEPADSAADQEISPPANPDSGTSDDEAATDENVDDDRSVEAEQSGASDQADDEDQTEEEQDDGSGPGDEDLAEDEQETSETEQQADEADKGEDDQAAVDDEASDVDESDDAVDDDVPAAETESPVGDLTTAADTAGETPEAETSEVEDSAEPAAETAETTEEDTDEGTTPGTTEERIEYRPLDEVRDDIARQLARPQASEALSNAVDQTRAELNRYFQQHVLWEAEPEDQRGTEPEPPDFQQLAERLGMVAGEIPLINALEADEYDLGRAFELDFSTGQIRRFPFTQMGFDRNLSLYQPKTISASDVDSKYVFWKTTEEAEFIPTLDQAREEVVRHWKMKKAIPLAKAKAEEYAQKVRDQAQPLSEVFGNNEDSNVVETGEFTWMTFGSTPTGVGAPRISAVPGTEYPGDQFMKDASSLKAGQTAVTINYPETTVYVVYMKGVTGSPEDLRELFVNEGLKMPVLYMARQDTMRSASGWYENLEKTWEVKWERPAMQDSGVR